MFGILLEMTNGGYFVILCNLMDKQSYNTLSLDYPVCSIVDVFLTS
jgi:hypothetical protein